MYHERSKHIDVSFPFFSASALSSLKFHSSFSKRGSGRLSSDVDRFSWQSTFFTGAPAFCCPLTSFFGSREIVTVPFSSSFSSFFTFQRVFTNIADRGQYACVGIVSEENRMHDQTSRGWPYSESLSRQDFLIFLYRPSLGETTSFRVYHILAPTILCTG